MKPDQHPLCHVLGIVWIAYLNQGPAVHPLEYLADERLERLLVACRRLLHDAVEVRRVQFPLHRESMHRCKYFPR